ncbi:MAG: superoxide dismutase [Gammaproteobacteria bacterium]|nr:superoxide dismutase [Gammaproteobacteria bacterium]
MMTYQLPDLDYDLKALEPHLSAEILELHHGKHHATYVKGANKALEALHSARSKGEFATINQLQKNLAFNLSGHVLHALFWKNLGPNGGGDPTGPLATRLKKDFGSLDAFRKQFAAAAKGIQGSGWAALCWEPTAGQLLVEQIHDHQDNVGQATMPILVLDMWEHAFYLQYRNVKADWVKAYWNIVNWQDVAERLARVSKLPGAV